MTIEAENLNEPQNPQSNIGAVMCGSCKHWQNNSRGKIGKCMISKIRHPMMYSGCGLYTREDFGCKLFQNCT